MPKEDVFLLDSNFWISYVITRRLHKLVSWILHHHLVVLTNRQLIDEIQEVLARPKFHGIVRKKDISEFIALHIKLCRFTGDEMVKYNLLSDPKDNFLLNIYAAGKATILVSGDKKLLIEAKENNFRVMTLLEFESLMES